MLMLDRVRRRADEFDILHFHIDQFHFPLFRPIAGLTADDLARAAGSARSAAALFRLPRDAAGVDLARAAQAGAACELRGERSAWDSGRPASPGPEAARRTTSPSSAASRRRNGRTARSRSRVALGVPLKIAAKVDRVDEAYFREQIEPLLDGPGVDFIGEINEHQKSAFLGEARALLFPDRLAGAVRPVDDRGHGLRHAGARVPLRLGAGDRRGRRHRRHRGQRRGGDRRRCRGSWRSTGSRSGSASSGASLPRAWPRITCVCMRRCCRRRSPSDADADIRLPRTAMIQHCEDADCLSSK